MKTDGGVGVRVSSSLTPHRDTSSRHRVVMPNPLEAQRQQALAQAETLSQAWQARLRSDQEDARTAEA
ncbi:hypothetical protein F0U62_09540 [Cystobacter fuscus]|nr:hypothetical protein F0U62_09540 [Cystobacter fuscus]